jgi:hypothetical protein
MSKDKELKTETEVTINKEVKQLKYFLTNKTVRIEPIPKPNEWKNLVGEALPQGFFLEGTERSFDLPMNMKTGQPFQVLNNIDRHYTPEFPDEKLTEMEYFSKLLGKDLSFTAIERNFWKGYMDPKHSGLSTKPFTVKVPSQGLSLNMNSIEDYLKLKVLEANVHSGWIAPSWAERFDKPSYMYAIVDEKISTDRKKELIELKRKAFSEYEKIADSEDLLREFMIVKDPLTPISRNTSKEWLANQVYDLAEMNPKYFLEIVQDENRTEKLIVYNACRAGALEKSGKDKYQTPGGEILGTMGDVIHLLKDPERIEFRKKIEYQIQNTKF